MKKARPGFGAYVHAVTDYLLAASMVPGHPSTEIALDKAEFYLEGAALYVTMPSERDLLMALRGAIDALADRHEDATALFEQLADLDATEPEPVEE